MLRPRPAALFVALSAAALLLSAVAHAGGPPPVMPGDLLGSTGIETTLISIDPATGAGTFRFDIGTFGSETEIELAPDGTLFATTGGGSADLITIDPDTGVETLIGQHDPGSIPGLEFVGNTLYGSYFGLEDTELVTIDTTTAALTIIGPMGYDPVRGLAYDPGTNTMYGVGTPPGQPGSPQPRSLDPHLNGLPGDELFTVDLATGATTPIGPTGFGIIGGIELGPNGVLYGGIADAGNGPGVEGDLVSLDKATGAATVIGSTGEAPISGLAFVPAPQGGPPVIEVPALSRLGLLLLAALLAGAALLVLRR